MSGTADIQRAIWEDEDFADLSVDARLLYIWSFSNERCNVAGLYKVRTKAMEVDTGLTEARTAAALAELERARFVTYVDGVLFVRSYVKHTRMRSPNMAIGIAKAVKAISPDHPQRRAFLEKYTVPGYEWLDPVPEKRDVGVLTEVVNNTVHPDEGEGLGNPSEGASEDLSRGSEGASQTASTSDSPVSKGRGLEAPSEGFQSRSRSLSRSKSNSSKERNDMEGLPDDFPVELLPVLDDVMARLLKIARERGCMEPPRAGVADTIAKYPKRLHVEVADNLGYWALHGKGKNRKILDIAARYRDWLKGEPDVLPSSSAPKGRLAQDRAAAA